MSEKIVFFGTHSYDRHAFAEWNKKITSVLNFIHTEVFLICIMQMNFMEREPYAFL